MEVFISWSGERSRAVAAALHELLPDMLQDVVAWMSAHDINAGARWSETLNAELESSNFGILCLTPENLNSPWLLFEAGSIAKSVTDSRVVPYLLDLKSTDVTYPLAQFQGVEATSEGTLKLVRTMNVVRKEPMDNERLLRIFERVWPDLEGKLKAVPKKSDQVGPRRDDRAILEEILQLVRAEKSPPQRQQPTEPVTPSSAVWKTLLEVSESDMKGMTIKELIDYFDAVKRRRRETRSGEEGMALDVKDTQALVEMERRGETEASARAAIKN